MFVLQNGNYRYGSGAPVILSPLGAAVQRIKFHIQMSASSSFPPSSSTSNGTIYEITLLVGFFQTLPTCARDPFLRLKSGFGQDDAHRNGDCRNSNGNAGASSDFYLFNI